MMRQAGRYHSHYQNLKKDYTFEQLCKTPALAAEVAMGPIRDFDFDAAILFSDILFPLEIMGTPLTFAPGPKLGWHLKTVGDLEKYNPADVSALSFQADALRLTRAALPENKSLIGFVGSPLTLYVFAVHGTHKTDLTDARNGLRDGRFTGFMGRLLPLLLDNMALQAAENPDALAVFDSCAGDISLDDYRDLYLPYLEKLISDFKARYPAMKLIYYGQGIGAQHWQLLKSLPIDVLGIDHGQDMKDAMTGFADRFALQGNFPPENLTLPEDECREKIIAYFDYVAAVPTEKRKGWVAGLGHGVTPLAREQNVRNFISELRARKW